MILKCIIVDSITPPFIMHVEDLGALRMHVEDQFVDEIDIAARNDALDVHCAYELPDNANEGQNRNTIHVSITSRATLILLIHPSASFAPRAHARAANMSLDLRDAKWF